MGDGIHTIIIQDILIRDDERNKGIRSKIIKDIVAMNKNVRQIILLCDNKENLKRFYFKNGFMKIKKYGIECFGIMN